MPRYPNELINTPLTPQALHDQKTRNNISMQNNESNIITTIDDAASIALKVTRNNYNYSPGAHAALSIDKDDAFVGGTPGTVLEGSTIDIVHPGAVTRYDNVEFQGEVSLGEQGTVIFTNCVFHEVVTGGPLVRTHFIGCVFRGQPNSTTLANAAGTLVIGCSRPSPAGPHNPVPLGALLETT